jgi:hypothetical protein
MIGAMLAHVSATVLDAGGMAEQTASLLACAAALSGSRFALLQFVYHGLQIEARGPLPDGEFLECREPARHQSLHRDHNEHAIC